MKCDSKGSRAWGAVLHQNNNISQLIHEPNCQAFSVGFIYPLGAKIFQDFLRLIRQVNYRNCAAIFKSKKNVVPTLTALLTEIVLPCKSKILLAIASPKPAPPEPRARLFSIR